MNAAPNHDLKIKKRIQLVHIAANELGLLDPKRHNTDPDDDYHRILARWNRQGTRQPVTSSLQMTYQQLGELLDFFKGLGFKLKTNHPSPRPSPPRGEGAWKKYESSVKGLKDEICDLARERWGAHPHPVPLPEGEGQADKDNSIAWELPLNNFCVRFGVKRWQWLDVAHGKEVKAALVRLQDQKPFATESTESTEKNDIPF